jgi:hypothetical protein
MISHPDGAFFKQRPEGLFVFQQCLFCFFPLGYVFIITQKAMDVRIIQKVAPCEFYPFIGAILTSVPAFNGPYFSRILYDIRK